LHSNDIDVAFGVLGLAGIEREPAGDFAQRISAIGSTPPAAATSRTSRPRSPAPDLDAFGGMLRAPERAAVPRALA